jgi:branched-chain amino acid transport system ATP-binding protein
VNALEASGLNTYYGKSHILLGVSLTLADGQVATLLGRNGAGKTTTLRSLLGLTPPRSGTVRVLGQDCTGWPPYRIAALGVGFVPEGRRVFANLSVEENLKVPLQRPGPWTIEKVYQLFPRLAQRRSHQGRQLSGGEQQMLAIGRALVLNPRILLLDDGRIAYQGPAADLAADEERLRTLAGAAAQSWDPAPAHGLSG